MVRKYVLKLFLMSFLLFTTLLLVGVIVIDLSFKIQQFLSKEQASPLGFIVNYYVIRLPLFLYYILPSSLLLSAMFTYFKMAKSNELLPVVVSGCDLRTFSLPFVYVAFVTVLIMAAAEEFVLPQGAAERSRTEALIYSSPLAINVVANDYAGNFLRGSSYDRIKLEVKDVRVNLMDKNGFLREYVTAERARWNESKKAWELYKAHIEEYEGNKRKFKQLEDGRLVEVNRDEELYVITTDIRPQDIEKRQLMSEQFMTLEEIMEKTKKYNREPYFKMLLYSRMVSPLAPLILLIGGLPFVVRINPKNFFIGVGLCAVVIVLYYLTTIVLYLLGNRDILRPVVATLVPTILMFFIALFNYMRMKT